jgi:hypothetical protein
MHDPINPSHYTHGSIECIEAIEDSMGAEGFKGFLKGNCLKYLWRYQQKNGAEDLKKAQWYLSRLIDAQEYEEDKAVAVKEQSKQVAEYIAGGDPDAYMISGCPDGFCSLPNVRQGPAEMFEPVG